MNENGQYMVTEGMTAKAYSTLDTAMDLINFKTSAIVLLSIVAILILIYQVAITVPLYAFSAAAITVLFFTKREFINENCILRDWRDACGRVT